MRRGRGDRDKPRGLHGARQGWYAESMYDKEDGPYEYGGNNGTMTMSSRGSVKKTLRKELINTLIVTITKNFYPL